MAVNDGVVAAVIPGAQAKNLGEIAALRHDLTERARSGKLRPADIAGATFTISNLGMYKVDAFSAIINPPQAAILAVGRITDRVVPVDGKPGIRPMMTMTSVERPPGRRRRARGNFSQRSGRCDTKTLGSGSDDTLGALALKED